MEKVTRRSFLKTGAAAMVPASFCTGAATRRDKPNNLLFLTDEQRPDTLAPYGNKQVQAPSLNRLACESVVFTRSYCTQPVCTSSRASILTGLWPHQSECTRNGIPLREDTKTLPELLNDPDYRTGYMGKWHLGDEIFPQHGFREWVSTEDTYIDGYGKGRDRTARSTYHHHLTKLGYTPDLSLNRFSRDLAANLPEEHCKPGFLANQACEFIRNHCQEPFALCVSYLEPHMPFHGPLDNLHTPDKVTLPQNFNAPILENEPLRNRIFREWYYDNGWEGAPLKTEADWRALTARYWGLVTLMDRSIGRILGVLEDMGLAENTIVVFTSDHGEMMGSHGLLGKTFSYEESARVPWFIRFPLHARQQILVDHPVSQIDLVPTLLHLMGKDPGAFGLPGQSLVPTFSGQKPNTDFVFVQWNSYYQDLVQRCNPEAAAPFKAWLQEMAGQEDIKRVIASQWRSVISPDGWKLTLGDGDSSQLFNLEKDPFELCNLFGRTEYVQITSELEKRLRAWQQETEDPVKI